jgi:signal transduction histidine kinase
LKDREGRLQNVLLTASVLKGEDGNIVAYRGILRDITRQRVLERQFFHAQKMESVGTLAGGIAHDFNNILGGILGYASLMKSKLPEDDTFYRYVDTIEKAAMRAANLTDQLLAFARGGRYHTTSVELGDVIEETLGIIGSTIDKSIEIESRLDPTHPKVEADAGQMQQVLMNLCLNAADAMPFGGKLTIEAQARTLSSKEVGLHKEAGPGQYVIVSVTDTGTGMDEATMERIFEPFFSTKENGKGTGLGLSMVYGVIENHGGFVTVDSTVGEGSSFKVHLPANGRAGNGTGKSAGLSGLSESLPEQGEPALARRDRHTVRRLAGGAS